MTLWGRCWHSWRPLCFLATGTCRRAWTTCSTHGRNTSSPPCRSCSQTQPSHIGRGGYNQWEVYPVCGSFSDLNICESSCFSVIRANILQFDVQLCFFAMQANPSGSDGSQTGHWKDAGNYKDIIIIIYMQCTIQCRDLHCRLYVYCRAPPQHTHAVGWFI